MVFMWLNGQICIVSIFEGKAIYNIILPNPPLKKEGLSLTFSKGNLEGLYKKKL